MIEEQKITLNDIETGKSCVIVKVHGYGGFRHRILEMGFVKGEHVFVIKNAPLQDPVEYKILGSHISLRRSEAKQIEVVELSNYRSDNDNFHGTISEETQEIIQKKQKTINVSLVGNPNCGKTSFFNFATGLHEKVGNYGGVTVEAKTGIFKRNGYTINMVDLPGTYSITEYTPEELYVRKNLIENTPDVVLNVIDASNLERNLFLTTQLIDMNFQIVIALNMFDELEKSGDKLDYKYLGQMLGIPFVPTTAYKGIGINNVLDTIIDAYEEKKGITKHIHINYGNTIEEAISQLKQPLLENKELTDTYSYRYLAIKLIENEKTTLELIKKEAKNHSLIIQIAEKQRQIISNEFNEDTEAVITDAKFGFIRGALKETYVQAKRQPVDKATRIDNLITNKWLGFPILLIFLWVMFQATFTLGAYPQEWIEMGVEWLGKLVANNLPEGYLNDFLVDGLIAGVGGVIVFLPNILILFFFISLMEDTGYMARATFILDKIMHKIGLHGRSFIPLLSGFGCSVPAIMATRTLENKKDRILTMLLIPFMSCSAKLPVYVLIVSAFFTKYQGLVLLSVYCVGICIAVLVSLLLKNTLFKKESEQFVMELPPYRRATARNLFIHMWAKSSEYLKKMGTVILAASAIIWVLSYFPQHNSKTEEYDHVIAQCQENVVLSETEKADSILVLESLRNAAQQENSYIGKMGKFFEPVMRPLGFDWKMSICILTGFAAKETVVSSMGILYNGNNADNEDDHSLINALRSETYSSGKRAGEQVFTPLVAYTFLIFILLYCPCVAAVVACRRETNGKWASFLALYTTAVAWIVAFCIYNIGMLF